jgi:hypothetical protein
VAETDEDPLVVGIDFIYIHVTSRNATSLLGRPASEARGFVRVALGGRYSL